MHWWAGSSLVQVMARCLFGAKPLTQPVLSWYKQNVSKKTLIKIWKFCFNKIYFKMSSAKCGPLCLVCWLTMYYIYVHWCLCFIATYHYSDITWAPRHIKSLATQLFIQQFVEATNKESMEALSLWRECTGGRLNKKDGLTRYGDSHVKDKTS